MCKLSRYRQTPDPSLFKSVLICNTLKRLERELDREGIRINFGPNGVSFVPANLIQSTSPSPSLASSFNSPIASPLTVTSIPSDDSPCPSPSATCPATTSLLQATLMTPVAASPTTTVPSPAPLESIKPAYSSSYSVSEMEVTPSGRLTPFPASTEGDSDDQEDLPMDSDDSAMDHSSSSSSSSESSSSSSDDSDSGLWSPEPSTSNNNPLSSLPTSSSTDDIIDPVNRVSSWTDSLLSLDSTTVVANEQDQCPSSSSCCLSKEADSSNVLTDPICSEAVMVNETRRLDITESEETTNGMMAQEEDIRVCASFDEDDPPALPCPPSISSSTIACPSIIKESSSPMNGLLHPTSSVLVYTVSAGTPVTASSSCHSSITRSEAASTTTTPSSSSSDEVFGDIDLSLYDFDLLSLPLSAPNENVVKLTPMTAEELMSSTVINVGQGGHDEIKEDITRIQQQQPLQKS